MVRTLIKRVLALALAVGACQASAITVFACGPEWAALAQTLLPEAKVWTATSHLQDPHHIEARPSLIAQLRSADFAICTGAGLEAGWLPTLQEKAGNAKVQSGQPTMFYATEYVELLNPYKGTVSPFSGDIHVHGNPHIHADPRRILIVAKALAARLGNVFPEKKIPVNDKLRGFVTELTRKIKDWEKITSTLQGRSVIAQHTSFDYLWHWLGIKPVADLEPKPGIPPTPAHLENVLRLTKTQNPVAIVIAQHHDPKPGRWLASKMVDQNKLLILPATVTHTQPSAIIEWFDLLVTQLSDAAK